MPRNMKSLAIVSALLATAAVAPCSSPAATADPAPRAVAPTTPTPDPVPQQLWGTWVPTVPGQSAPHMVLAAHDVAFYPTASAQDAHVGLAWASGPDQITFGTTDACDTADTYTWKISNRTLTFTGGDTD